MPDDFILPQGDIADMESVFKTLEEVAGEYDEDSNRRRAIELASKALLFAFTQQVQNSFRTFLNTFDRPLTEKEKDHLKSMNIDLDTEGVSESG